MLAGEPERGAPADGLDQLKLRARLAADAADGAHRGRPLFGDERGAPGAHDAGLLRRDRRDRSSEDRGVVTAHRCEDRDRRIERVRRVEPAAEPDLDDGHRASALGERAHRDRERELECRRLAGRGMLAVQSRDGGAQVADRARERGLGEHPPVDADALAVRLQVRGREQPRANVSGVQDRGEERRGRALALGPGDEDDAHRPIRITEKVEQRAHSAEAPAGRAVRARGPTDPKDGIGEAEEPVHLRRSHER